MGLVERETCTNIRLSIWHSNRRCPLGSSPGRHGPDSKKCFSSAALSFVNSESAGAFMNIDVELRDVEDLNSSNTVCSCSSILFLGGADGRFTRLPVSDTRNAVGLGPSGCCGRYERRNETCVSDSQWPRAWRNTVLWGKCPSKWHPIRRSSSVCLLHSLW